VESPEDRDRREDEGKELSNLADAYRKAAPYLSASTTLVASVGVFAWLGWWVDQKVGNRTPWFLLLGALLGMTGGFVGFFWTVLGKRRK